MLLILYNSLSNSSQRSNFFWRFMKGAMDKFFLKINSSNLFETSYNAKKSNYVQTKKNFIKWYSLLIKILNFLKGQFFWSKFDLKHLLNLFCKPTMILFIPFRITVKFIRNIISQLFLYFTQVFTVFYINLLILIDQIS